MAIIWKYFCSYAGVFLIIFIALVCLSCYLSLLSPCHGATSSLVGAHNFPVQSGKHISQSSPNARSSQNHCNVTGMKSWENGLVTLLQPRIKASCEALRKGNERELKRVKKQLQTWVSAESDEGFLESLNNCSHIVDEYSNNFYVSPEEENFPVAYILVVYTMQCAAGAAATKSHLPTPQLVLYPPRCKART